MRLGRARATTPKARRARRDALIIRRYLAGDHRGDIAKAAGCTTRTVSATVAKAALPRRLSRAQVDDSIVAERYQSGQTPTQIAAAIGVSRGTVENALRRAGVTRRSRTRRDDETTRASIVSLYRDGLPGPAIARQLGISQSTVYRILNAVARATTPKARRARRNTLIIRRYLAGDRLTDIAKAAGCTMEAVGYVLAKAGVPRQRRRGPRSQIDAAQVTTLHREGLSGSAIARQLGIHRTTVYKIMKDTGTAPRRSTATPL